MILSMFGKYVLRHKDKSCKKENENITQPLNNIKKVPYVAIYDHCGLHLLKKNVSSYYCIFISFTKSILKCIF